ncbi:MAG: hypothetical protein R3B97_09455 [Dehalococcoidia bacterium]|nr:hypothetical protein [Dehalococcoidia bacterium]MCB9484755.1 hypothetical protein [Thermoflexaceae bacterium]
MSAGWRAVATWIARVFHRRHDDWVRPWNGITMRALYEDVHLPFEAGASTVIAQRTETAIPAAARTLAPTGTEDTAATASQPADVANEPTADSRRVA